MICDALSQLWTSEPFNQLRLFVSGMERRICLDPQTKRACFLCGTTVHNILSSPGRERNRRRFLFHPCRGEATGKLLPVEQESAAKVGAMAALVNHRLLFNGCGQVWIIDIQKP